jgi:hypothetical protein
VTTPPPPQWHELTPEQQAWHMHQQTIALQQAQLAIQRQQAATQRRNRNTVTTLVGLFVWTPLAIAAVVFVVWLITASM